MLELSENRQSPLSIQDISAIAKDGGKANIGVSVPDKFMQTPSEIRNTSLLVSIRKWYDDFICPVGIKGSNSVLSGNRHLIFPP